MASAQRGGVSAVKSPSERAALLERVLQLWARQGWRVESRAEFGATIEKRRAAPRMLELLLTVLTLGALGGVRRRTIAVDESGRILQRKG